MADIGQIKREKAIFNNIRMNNLGMGKNATLWLKESAMMHSQERFMTI